VPVEFGILGEGKSGISEGSFEKSENFGFGKNCGEEW
jgi:hypothetical protein